MEAHRINPPQVLQCVGIGKGTASSGKSNGKSFSSEDSPSFGSWHLPGMRDNGFLTYLPAPRMLPSHVTVANPPILTLMLRDEPETLPHAPSQRQADPLAHTLL